MSRITAEHLAMEDQLLAELATHDLPVSTPGLASRMRDQVAMHHCETCSCVVTVQCQSWVILPRLKRLERLGKVRSERWADYRCLFWQVVR